MVPFWPHGGSEGSGYGQFYQPYGIAVDSSGNVYVADSGNHRIQKFSVNGTFLASWGSSGQGEGQFNNPFGIAVDGTCNVYVAYTNNHRIQKFTYCIAITTDFHLSAGLTLFGYPFEPQTGYTSYDFIADLGTEMEVSRIQRYDPNTKGYETTTYANGSPCGEEFPLVSGEGYLVYLKMDKSVFLTGATIIVNPAISCHEGLNLISIPKPPSRYTSYDLLSYLGSSDEITSIKRFNRERGISETTYYCFGKPAGDRFNIVSGEAYLIHMRGVKAFTLP